MRRRTSLLLICALLLFLLAGCASGTEESADGGEGTLRVGVRSDINRFGYYNERTEKYSGLEIDIAEEMASRMGYDQVEYVTVVPETKQDLLMSDEIDCLIACYSITESRKETMDFSPAYYEDDSVIMVENSSLFTEIDDLKGCTIGTVAGANTAAEVIEKFLESGLTDGEVISHDEDNMDIQFDTFQILKMDTYYDLVDALEEGVIDAMCADDSIIETFMTDQRSVLNFTIATQDYGVATQKGSPLSEPVSEAISSMLEDGTIDGILDKWF